MAITLITVQSSHWVSKNSQSLYYIYIKEVLQEQALVIYVRNCAVINTFSMDSQRCLACLPTQIPIIRPINYFFYFYFIYISIIDSGFSSKSYLTFWFIGDEIGEYNIISVSIFFIISIYERYVSLLSIVLKLLFHI